MRWRNLSFHAEARLFGEEDRLRLPFRSLVRAIAWQPLDGKRASQLVDEKALLVGVAHHGDARL